VLLNSNKEIIPTIFARTRKRQSGIIVSRGLFAIGFYASLSITGEKGGHRVLPHPVSLDVNIPESYGVCAELGPSGTSLIDGHNLLDFGHLLFEHAFYAILHGHGRARTTGTGTLQFNLDCIVLLNGDQLDITTVAL